MGNTGRQSILFLTFMGLILAGLSLTAGGCDAEADAAKTAVKAYYDAVARADRESQIAQWLPDRQAEAAREADAWSKRDKDGLKLTEVHVSDGPAGDQRIAHVTIATNDKARPGRTRYESKVLLLQQAARAWLVRDAR